jgi:hypothetical protein
LRKTATSRSRLRRDEPLSSQIAALQYKLRRMFAAALLASLLAQAEQAPTPARPDAAPATTAPAPASGAPAAATSAPAPATPGAPTPATSAPVPPAPQGPAAAAPPVPPPAVAEPATPPPANSASVYVRYAYRLGAGSDDIVPTSGFSLGGEFERRLAAFPTGIELGIAMDFFYDRFTKDVIATSVGPMGDPAPGIGTRTLSQTTFALMETTGWRYADMRLYVGVGAGLTVGYFVSPDISSTGDTDLEPLARAVFGFDFAIAPRTAAILRVDYTHTFYRNIYFVGPTGESHPVFGDLFDAGIGFLLRF